MLLFFFFLLKEHDGDANGKRRRSDKAERRAQLIAEDLEDEDLVSLDGVEVVVHGEEDLGGNV